ncbi:MAG: hypothetical protein ACK444_08945, partial [Flavobacteriales bacterium]
MRNLLTYACLLLLSLGLFAQGDDCATATPINNVLNYCSGNAFFTNAGSTPSAYGIASCWAGNATEDVWFSFTALGT